MQDWFFPLTSSPSVLSCSLRSLTQEFSPTINSCIEKKNRRPRFQIQVILMAQSETNPPEFKLILVGDGGVGMLKQLVSLTILGWFSLRQNNFRQTTCNRRIWEALRSDDWRQCSFVTFLDEFRSDRFSSLGHSWSRKIRWFVRFGENFFPSLLHVSCRSSRWLLHRRRLCDHHVRCDLTHHLSKCSGLAQGFGSYLSEHPDRSLWE